MCVPLLAAPRTQIGAECRSGAGEEEGEGEGGSRWGEEGQDGKVT